MAFSLAAGDSGGGQAPPRPRAPRQGPDTAAFKLLPRPDELRAPQSVRQTSKVWGIA